MHYDVDTRTKMSSAAFKVNVACVKWSGEWNY